MILNNNMEKYITKRSLLSALRRKRAGYNRAAHPGISGRALSHIGKGRNGPWFRAMVISTDCLIDDIIEENFTFTQHQEDDLALYREIYAIAEDALGKGLPDGCTPRQAVRLLAAEVIKWREASGSR
jgi:hypothetical protein